MYNLFFFLSNPKTKKFFNMCIIRISSCIFIQSYTLNPTRLSYLPILHNLYNSNNRNSCFHKLLNFVSNNSKSITTINLGFLNDLHQPIGRKTSSKFSVMGKCWQCIFDRNSGVRRRS